jgi:hypothetical protein
LDGIYELVREVLLGGVLPHLDPRSSDYTRVAGAGLRLHPEELPEQDPKGLDPQKSFAEMNEDCSVKYTVGVEVEVLDAVVPHEPLEEVARWEGEPTLCESHEHRDLVFTFLHRVWIPGGSPPHVHLLLPDEPAVEKG